MESDEVVLDGKTVVDEIVPLVSEGASVDDEVIPVVFEGRLAVEDTVPVVFVGTSVVETDALEPEELVTEADGTDGLADVIELEALDSEVSELKLLDPEVADTDDEDPEGLDITGLLDPEVDGIDALEEDDVGMPVIHEPVSVSVVVLRSVLVMV
jgi:hypothetical protein